MQPQLAVQNTIEDLTPYTYADVEERGSKDQRSSETFINDQDTLKDRAPSNSPSPCSRPLTDHRQRKRRDIFSLHHRLSLNDTLMQYGHYQRVRPSLHRVIGALFSSAHHFESSSSSANGEGLSFNVVQNNPLTQQTIPENTAISSSSNWSNIGGTQASYASLEFVGPGAFLFSSPTLENHASGAEESRPNSLLSRSQPSLYRRGSGTASFSGITRSNSFSTATEETFDDYVLEPYQSVELTRSLSDVLLMDDDHDDSGAEVLTSLNALTRANAQHCSQQLSLSSNSHPPSLPMAILRYLFTFLDHNSYDNLRLTCRDWRLAINTLHKPGFSSSQNLPTELLQYIYNYLNPIDFNAARHTCRTWMAASMDMNLLSRMLRRGGWWTGVHGTVADLWERDERTVTSPEWFASCYLARECALAPATISCHSEWTGKKARSAIVRLGYVDFVRLSNSRGEQMDELIFTASVCGNYVLIARGRTIYIYRLCGQNIKPLTSLVCPRRVLSMSMDSSSGRFAVAALLENRMGLVCDIRLEKTSQEIVGVDMDEVDGEWIPTQQHSTQVSSSVDQKTHSKDNASNIGTTSKLRLEHVGNPSVPTEYTPPLDAINVHNGIGDYTLLNADASNDRGWMNRTWYIKLRGARTTGTLDDPGKLSRATSPSKLDDEQQLHVEKGPRSIYRNLCSEEDPPRSVAICPQRRCVAFGCSAGIELHWVDALTGRGMNRWFPLTAPSDILFFLPPRQNVDTATKLRLISSAVHPVDRPALCERFFPSRPSLSAFWGGFGMDNRVGPPPSSISNYDHYRAVPLSDGYHVLFTEPETNALCLGSDAPLGGPNKLLRKVIFLPSQPGIAPRIYTAAHNLRYGARILVSFAETLMFYSVPPDLLALSKYEHPILESGNEEDHPYDWLDWWQESDDVLYQKANQNHLVWPLRLRGICIARIPDVVELAVNHSPQLALWAFDRSGKAHVWGLTAGNVPATIVQSRIGRDGLVAEVFELDAGGDVVMRDADKT